jgi:hypothetical protein
MRPSLACSVLLLCAACNGGPRAPGLRAQQFPLPTTAQPLGGSADDDVWVPSFDSATRWNGSAMTTVDLGGFRAITIAGAAPHDLWLGGITENSDPNDGGAPRLRHWDGTSLQPSDAGSSVLRLFAVGRDDIWGAGLDGLVHFDGVTWTASPAPVSEGLFAAFYPVAASGAGDVWARYSVSAFFDTPGHEELYHYDGAGWAMVPLPAKFVPTDGAWAPSANELWLSGDGPRIWRRIGGTWSTLEARGQTRACSGRSAGDAFCISQTDDLAQLWHWDGRTLTLLDEPSLDFSALWVGPASVWVTARDRDGHRTAIRYPL